MASKKRVRFNTQPIISEIPLIGTRDTVLKFKIPRIYKRLKKNGHVKTQPKQLCTTKRHALRRAQWAVKFHSHGGVVDRHVARRAQWAVKNQSTSK